MYLRSDLLKADVLQLVERFHASKQKKKEKEKKNL